LGSFFVASYDPQDYTVEVFDLASTGDRTDLQLELGFLLYSVGMGRQITYPRKRLFITQRWLLNKNLSPRKRAYRAVA
jgi:hypothetical protein